LVDRTNELRDLFDTEDFSAGSKLTKIVEAFDGTSGKTGIIQALTTSQTTIGANTVRDIVNAMNTLHSLLENIEFVQVQLSASATEGNDPLIVRFNALGTEDPSGNTATDEQIEWDLDGDGSFSETQKGGSMNQNGVEASDVYGAAVSATFTQPGTYRVRLRVRSSDENIAAGVSTVSIKVEPAKSKIVLNATAGGESTNLADFRTFPETDLTSYKVTMTEALEGVILDASQTTDGDGNTGAAGGIVYYEWDFGDNEIKAGKYVGSLSDAGDIVMHKYSQEGTYSISLTVTDSTGVQDRKLFTLYVASPAARMNVTPASGPVGTTFEFDGSGSNSDVGNIVSWQWTALLEGTAVTLDKNTGESITASFDQPGVYTVTLEVADNDKTDTVTTSILVESTPPVATYDYSIPSSTEPATVFFDATDSYDPDEGDTITYEWDFDGVEGTDYQIIDEATDLSTATVQFLKTGDYKVALTIYDQHEGDLKKSDTAQATISIDSILDVGLEIEGENARHLDENAQSTVEFKALSEVGTAFQIDYGDGSSGYSDTIASGQSIFTHTYEAAGVFDVEVTALDDTDGKNSISKRLYIGSGDAPIAVLSVSSKGEDIGSGTNIHGNIKTQFTFDATESVNIDGSKNTLAYSWNFGDGVTASQGSVTHVFQETSTYTITLTVRDKNDNSITNEATTLIKIEGIPPEIHSLTVIPQGTTLTTPLKVNVSVDADDLDGKVTSVKGWYYDLNDTATKLGEVISQTNNFTLLINTKGVTGEEVSYGFAAEVTSGVDTVGTYDELDPSEIPTLTVTNGTNESPVASFTVDKTSVYIGEDVTFSSSAYDPDGNIVSYWWDIDGDGSFYNNDPQENPSFVYNFTQVHPEGVKVSLKVEDDSGATAISQPVTIFVDSLSAAPDAAFLTNVNGTTVDFVNNSILDTKNGASFGGIYWDFDGDTDSNGNGVKDDDIDSLDENPSHTYPALGTYQVKMTIVDNTGQTDSVSQEVNVMESSAPTAAFSYAVTDKMVEFTNESIFDTANNVEVRSYNWDLDLNADTNGDTDPENDTDATTKNPSFEYADYGDYDVKLSVEDSAGKTDTSIQTITVPNPIQSTTALLTSSPTPNTLSQIILPNDGDNVTFFYGADGGSGKFTYELDKNIFYDTDGDGIRDNDVDFSDNSSGSWKTPFFISYGNIVTKLTVTDTDTGETDIATLQVVFEGSLGGANLFNATPSEILLLILSALLTAIFGISLTFRYKPQPHL